MSEQNENFTPTIGTTTESLANVGPTVKLAGEQAPVAQPEAAEPPVGEFTIPETVDSNEMKDLAKQMSALVSDVWGKRVGTVRFDHGVARSSGAELFDEPTTYRLSFDVRHKEPVAHGGGFFRNKPSDHVTSWQVDMNIPGRSGVGGSSDRPGIIVWDTADTSWDNIGSTYKRLFDKTDGLKVIEVVAGVGVSEDGVTVYKNHSESKPVTGAEAAGYLGLVKGVLLRTRENPDQAAITRAEASKVLTIDPIEGPSQSFSEDYRMVDPDKK